MMMAMSVQCVTCGLFIYKGTKFNMRKEDALGEDYLGIQIYRFHFRCPRCASEITFKTDPQNRDYLVEQGAYRTAEPLMPNEYFSRIKNRDDNCLSNSLEVPEVHCSKPKLSSKILSNIDDLHHKRARQEVLSFESLMNVIHPEKNTKTKSQESDV